MKTKTTEAPKPETAPKPLTQTSIFKIAVAAVVLGPFLVIALAWLANYALPIADADAFKKPLFAVWTYVTGTAFMGVVINRSLVTFGLVLEKKDRAGQTPPKETPDE